MARFAETVNIRQVNPSSGFIQQSNSLLNRLESFSNQAVAVSSNIAAERGQEEAQQVELTKEGGITQAPTKREASLGETLLTGGISTRQYNKSLETAYLASLGTDVNEGINALANENPDNIIAFNEKVAGFAKGVLQGIDPAMRQQVTQFLDSKISSSRNRVHANTIKKNKAAATAESFQAITSFGNEAATLARQGEKIAAAEALMHSFSVIDGMVEAGELASNKASVLKREQERESSEQALRLQFDNIATDEGVTKAFEELEAMANKPKKGWTPDEWDTFISSEQADLRQKAVRVQQSKAVNDLATARQVSELKIMAKTGVDTQGNPAEASSIMGQTEAMFNSGAISGNERSSIMTSQIQRMQEDAKVALSKQKVAAKVSGASSIPLTQKDVDLTWDQDILPVIENLPANQKNTAIAQFVDSTKIVPSQVVSQTNNNLNSEDFELVSNSADLMDRLDGVRGIPDTNFSPTDRAYAETVVGLMQNMEPQEAIKLARQNTNPNDSGRIDARKFIIKDEKFQTEYPDIIDSHFDPFFGDNVVDDISRGQLTTEYKTLFEQHFIAGMSEDKAKLKSLELIERNWGVDQSTNRMLKYPTQDYYAVNGSVDYIKRDLFTSVADSAVGLPAFTSKDIMLVSDDTTARTASGGAPSYLVVINTGEGGLVPLMGFRYMPDMQKQVLKEQKANEELLASGRKAPSRRDKEISESLQSFRGF